MCTAAAIFVAPTMLAANLDSSRDTASPGGGHTAQGLHTDSEARRPGVNPGSAALGHLGKFLNLSGPQFSPLKKEVNNGT